MIAAPSKKSRLFVHGRLVCSRLASHAWYVSCACVRVCVCVCVWACAEQDMRREQEAKKARLT